MQKENKQKELVAIPAQQLGRDVLELQLRQLRQLSRYTAKNMVVQFPGLVQFSEVPGSLVFLAPPLGLVQVVAVGLDE